MSDFETKLEEYTQLFNRTLREFCENLKCTPTVLKDSLTYSLLIGGKRIRPVIMLAAGDFLGVDKEKLLPFALSLELIHTYSLIHDDLPDMDNDDYRRGKPSNHKVFGTANAILAGDGLLNTAYSILFEQCFKGNEYISAAKCICDSAGINGMIAGQSADLLYEHNSAVDEDTLNFIYQNKTGKLLGAAMLVPSILCGGKYYSELKELSKKIGFMFQLTDDILDVEGKFDKLGKTVGKDAAEGKFTGISLYGLDKCKLLVDITGDVCYKILDCLNGDNTFFIQFVSYLKTRIS